jgi:hypothetical protein
LRGPLGRIAMKITLSVRGVSTSNLGSFLIL